MSASSYLRNAAWRHENIPNEWKNWIGNRLLPVVPYVSEPSGDSWLVGSLYESDSPTDNDLMPMPRNDDGMIDWPLDLEPATADNNNVFSDLNQQGCGSILRNVIVKDYASTDSRLADSNLFIPFSQNPVTELTTEDRQWSYVMNLDITFPRTIIDRSKSRIWSPFSHPSPSPSLTTIQSQRSRPLTPSNDSIISAILSRPLPRSDSARSDTPAQKLPSFPQKCPNLCSTSRIDLARVLSARPRPPLYDPVSTHSHHVREHTDYGRMPVRHPDPSTPRPPPIVPAAQQSLLRSLTLPDSAHSNVSALALPLPLEKSWNSTRALRNGSVQSSLSPESLAPPRVSGNVIMLFHTDPPKTTVSNIVRGRTSLQSIVLASAVETRLIQVTCLVGYD
ncbi:hypothetical protein EDB87DRAFT_1751581 [Lactarius vividus]|nr:hypothetical protein EDB87DRAFT_1751581 [Lactarius vividus]